MKTVCTAAVALAFLLAGCGGGNGDESNPPTAPPTGGETVPLTGTVGTGTTP